VPERAKLLPALWHYTMPAAMMPRATFYRRCRPFAAYAAFLAPAGALAQDPDHTDVNVRETSAPLATVVDYPPELIPAPRVELMQAKRLADAGRHLEAARLYEALFADSGDARLLYHAAIARSRALQFRRTTLLLERFRTLAGPLAEPVQAHIAAKITAYSVQLVDVNLRLVERRGLDSHPVAVVPGARVTLEAAGEPPISADLAAPLRLDPTVYRVTVEVPGYLPATETLRAEHNNGWVLAVTRRTVPLILRFGPPKALRRVKLRLTASDRTDLPPISRDLDGPNVTISLTTGNWQLAADSPRHHAAQALVVGQDPAPVDIVLRPRPATRLAKPRKFVIGIGVGMGVSFYGGVGLLLGGVNIETKAKEKNVAQFEAEGGDADMPDAASLAAVDAAYPTADHHRKLRRASNLQAAGTVVASTGVGMIFGLLPAILEAKPRAAYTTLGLGGAALLGGSVWMAHFVRRQHDRLDPTDPAHRVADSGLDGHRLGASMILGVGIGLTVTSTIILLGERARRTRSIAAAPLAAPNLAGLLVSGAF
jgi:hypothetical protein